MKKIIYIFLSFLSYYNLVAQTSEVEVPTYGGSFEVNLGNTEDGVGILVNYNHNLNQFNFLHVGLYLSFAEYKYNGEKIPYALYSIQTGYTLNVWKNLNRKARISVFGGMQTGYEVINKGNEKLSPGILVKDKSKFVVGPYLGGEFNFVIGHNSSLVLRGQESFHVNSDAGDFTPYIGVGIRYLIY